MKRSSFLSSSVLVSLGLTSLFGMACTEGTPLPAADGSTSAASMTGTAGDTMSATTGSATENGTGTTVEGTTMGTDSGTGTGTATDTGATGAPTEVGCEPLTTLPLPEGSLLLQGFDGGTMLGTAVVPPYDGTDNADPGLNTLIGAAGTVVTDDGVGCPGALSLEVPFTIYQDGFNGQAFVTVGAGTAPVDWSAYGALHASIKVVGEGDEIGHLESASLTISSGDPTLDPADQNFFAAFAQISTPVAQLTRDWQEVTLAFPAAVAAGDLFVDGVSQWGVGLLVKNTTDGANTALTPPPPAAPVTTTILVDDVWLEPAAP